MNKFCISLITVICLSNSSLAFAQRKAPKAPVKTKTFLGPGDHLQRTLQNVKRMEETYIQEKMKIDPDSFDILENLKNPFIPQLPKKEEKQLPTKKPKTVKPAKKKKPEPVIEDNTPKIPNPKFTISGLVWNTDRPQAIINNQIFDVGDTIQSWTITEIKKEGVEVKFRDQTFFVEK